MKPKTLEPPVDLDRDHVLGSARRRDYTRRIRQLRLPTLSRGSPGNRGTAEPVWRARYVFRHVPIPDSDDAVRAAEPAEFGAKTSGRFWEVHEALMERGPAFSSDDLEHVAHEFDLPSGEATAAVATSAAAHVREDIGRRNGVRVTFTFFINGRRYVGAWDESSLADAMLGSLGHRIQSAAFQFVPWDRRRECSLDSRRCWRWCSPHSSEIAPGRRTSRERHL